MDFLSGIMQAGLTFFYDITIMMGLPNYGLAIILLTVVIKMALYPLTVKQVKSMKGLQDLQPKMKELQEKYKGNKEKLNKEMAQFYKEAGVNPLAGCLPLLVQMPILIAIFFAIRDYNYVNEPSFFWLANLSQANPSDPYYIIPVLAAVTTYIQSKQTMTDTSNAQSKMMLNIMPLFIGYITITFPAGLGLYWVTSNIIQILQQWFMYRKPAKAKV
ncbi:MAG: yidC2 [Firmicutes bacterium]|nr:yidC2 [Bacillota bacterium]